MIAGYHWFTDWGRDTMISLEGLTLTTGRSRRGRLHPAHLRPLRPRRPDPQPVSRGPEARASTTRPTRRSGSSTPSTATSRPPATARRSHAPAPDADRHRRPSPRGARGSASASIPRRPACARGPRATSSPGWTPRSATGSSRPRRGKAVEINALWYNALQLMEGWVGEDPRRRRRAAATRATPSRPGDRSTRGSGTTRGATSTTWSTARTATIRRAAPTSSSPSRCGIRCSTRARWEAVLDVVARAAADAGRPALAGARRSRLTRPATTATCAPATRPITRARSGPG